MQEARGLGRRLGRLPTVLSAVLAVGLLGLGCAVVAPTASADDPGGLRVLNATRLSANQIRLQVFSPAMGEEEPVTLLLPDGYAEGDSFPVLYAFGGAEEDDDRKWATRTDLPAFAASHGALVVLPGTERGGFFSNWQDGSRKWETFHTEELPALIQSKYKGSDRQALLGVSIGGFAAMKYAAHHPGRYVAAASLSGTLVSSTPGMTELYQKGMRRFGQDPARIWGDPSAQRGKWVYEDPSEHLDGLRSTKLYTSASLGLPRGDGSASDPTVAQRLSTLSKNPKQAVSQISSPTSFEQIAYDSTTLFARKAEARGLDITTDFPVLGVHDWDQWISQYKVAWSKVLGPALGL